MRLFELHSLPRIVVAPAAKVRTKAGNLINLSPFSFSLLRCVAFAGHTIYFSHASNFVKILFAASNFCALYKQFETIEKLFKQNETHFALYSMGGNVWVLLELEK